MTGARSASRTGAPSPPLRSSDDRGGGGEWKLLTTAHDLMTAHIIEGRLTEEGVDSYLDTSNPAPGAFLKPFGDPMAPVKIFVHGYDYERASLLLYEAEHEPHDPTATPSKKVRTLWTLTISIVIATSIIFLLELFGYGPCRINLIC